MAQNRTPYERLDEAGLLGDQRPSKDDIELLNKTLTDEDVDKLIDVGTRLKAGGKSPGIRF